VLAQTPVRTGTEPTTVEVESGLSNTLAFVSAVAGTYGDAHRVSVALRVMALPEPEDELVLAHAQIDKSANVAMDLIGVLLHSRGLPLTRLPADTRSAKRYFANPPRGCCDLGRTRCTVERFVREWLNNQAAGGYVTYDPASGRYSMAEESSSRWRRKEAPRSFPARSR
jgi:hypothetical protein